MCCDHLATRVATFRAAFLDFAQISKYFGTICWIVKCPTDQLRNNLDIGQNKLKPSLNVDISKKKFPLFLYNW